MIELEYGWQLAFIAVLVGGMWSSYKIGFTEGSGKMIDFCKTKAKNGLVTIHFFGENIEFIDTLDYNHRVLDAISKKLEEDASS
tara:strand:+ start:351 stop:602 length:252 start_codon:yes stop_codon:yes gene_type:complete